MEQASKHLAEMRAEFMKNEKFIGPGFEVPPEFDLEGYVDTPQGMRAKMNHNQTLRTRNKNKPLNSQHLKIKPKQKHHGPWNQRPLNLYPNKIGPNHQENSADYILTSMELHGNANYPTDPEDTRT